MQKFSDYRPTGFDSRGVGSEDREDWLVLGVIQTRDSDSLEQSNFATALEILGGESETVSVDRFGHWGPGWFEIIVIDNNDTVAVAKAEEIEASLSDYPVLDEDDFSRREHEAEQETWDCCYRSDFQRALETKFHLRYCASFDPTNDQLDELAHTLQEETGRYPEACGNDEFHFFLDDLVEACTLEQLSEHVPELVLEELYADYLAEAIERNRCTTEDELTAKDYRAQWAREYFDRGDIETAIETIELV